MTPRPPNPSSSDVRRPASARLLAVTALLAAPALGAASGPPSGRGHVMPLVPQGAIVRAAPVGAHLSYWGGPVISNVEVVMVLWGSGTYQSFVQSTPSPSVASFYSEITNSAYLDWLAEYDTSITPSGGGSGTSQSIGRGTFLAQYAISPVAANDGATIDDTQIEAELLAQIAAGQLPAPVTDPTGHPNTLYMIHFPAGKTITLKSGTTTSTSCVDFCAYHSTAQDRSGADYYYGVLPDLTATGCNTGCGSGAPFANQTAIASHELVESITDAGVGLATALAPPLAWYDSVDNMEIADLCQTNGTGTVVGTDGVSYTVEKEWSNLASSCIVSRTLANDFAVAVAPGARQVARGLSATYTVSTAVTSGSPETIALAVASLPGGLTASLAPASVTAGSSSTLTVTASLAAALQTTAFTVTGTAASGVHSAVASITVLPALSITPASATLAPRATRTFTAAGGSATGYAWSLSTNASGGAVDAATGAYQAGSTGGVTDVIRLADSAGDLATVSVAVTAGVSITPGSASLAPGATQTFAASGGSGTGYAWTLATNASGGAIDAATGAYQVGATGGVTDVVRVTDSLGNAATASVAVGPAVAKASTGSGGSSHGCGYGGDGALPSLLLVAALALARRRAARPVAAG